MAAGLLPDAERGTRNARTRERANALPAGKADVQRLDVGEVAALHDALLDQALQDASAPAAADAQLVGQRIHRLRDTGRQIHIVAYTPLIRPEGLLDFDRADPQQVHRTTSTSPATPCRFCAPLSVTYVA